MKRITILTLAVAGLVSMPGLFAQSTTRQPLIARASRQAAPALAMHDARGRAIALTKQRGKVVLLDFWATWCTGCKTEIPWYVEFDRTYRAKGLASIGVALDEEGWSAVSPYLTAHPISYTVVTATPAQNPAYNLAGLPVTMLLDRQGRIAVTHAGVVDRTDWESKIIALLGEH
jgi:cytochrome c biogenesis protein CcmG/thiol:disulfide interchange protein DsbE